MGICHGSLRHWLGSRTSMHSAVCAGTSPPSVLPAQPSVPSQHKFARVWPPPAGSFRGYGFPSSGRSELTGVSHSSKIFRPPSGLLLRVWFGNRPARQSQGRCQYIGIGKVRRWGFESEFEVGLTGPETCVAGTGVEYTLSRFRTVH
jgi:hypothetical protein